MIPDWLPPVLDYMLKGLRATLWIAFLSTLFATLLGVAIGVTTVARSRFLRYVGLIYVDIFRGVPSLLVLLFVFFSLPQMGVSTSPLVASVLGLATWGAANIAEITRGAVQSVPRTQEQGAEALGMGRWDTLVYVVAPQAVRRFLPPYVGQVTVLIQATALTSIVGVVDVLGSARQMMDRLSYVDGNSHAIAIYGLVLVAFFAICYPLTLLAQWLEGRLRT